MLAASSSVMRPVVPEAWELSVLGVELRELPLCEPLLSELAWLLEAAELAELSFRSSPPSFLASMMLPVRASTAYSYFAPPAVNSTS